MECSEGGKTNEAELNRTFYEILEELGLETHHTRFNEMSAEHARFNAEHDSFISELFSSNANPDPMTTEEQFCVDTEDCASRTKCDTDTTDRTSSETEVAADDVDMDVVDEDKVCCDTSSLDDDMHDLYGSRSYGLPSSRPTMISPKYRQKEERRKVLKLSLNKMKHIEDPESSLRRSVLINNTVRRLQREAREEKSQKNQISMSYTQSKCFGISSDFITKQEQNLKVDVFATSRHISAVDQLLDITNLPVDVVKTTKCDGVTDCLDCDEAISDLAFPGDHRSTHMKSSSTSRKRSIDETSSLDDEECDVLRQFYLPLTPRIPSLEDDEDEDVNVVDIDTTPVVVADEPAAKRQRLSEDCSCDTTRSPDAVVACCLTAADRLRDNLPASFSPSVSLSLSPPSPSPSSSPASSCSTTCTSSPSSSPLLSPSATSTTTTTTSCSSSSLPSSPCPSFDEWVVDDSILQLSHASPYSCGHSSMMNEIVVYHNLIASFES